RHAFTAAARGAAFILGAGQVDDHKDRRHEAQNEPEDKRESAAALRKGHTFNHAYTSTKRNVLLGSERKMVCSAVALQCLSINPAIFLKSDPAANPALLASRARNCPRTSSGTPRHRGQRAGRIFHLKRERARCARPPIVVLCTRRIIPPARISAVQGSFQAHVRRRGEL